MARAVRRLLDAIAATLNRPGVGSVSWTIVSPLARGADRLVAAAVLERPGGRLEVVTPFPLAEYRRDFEAGADLAEFEDLLARATGHPHPHLQAAISNYAALLQAMGQSQEQVMATLRRIAPELFRG